MSDRSSIRKISSNEEEGTRDSESSFSVWGSDEDNTADGEFSDSENNKKCKSNEDCAYISVFSPREEKKKIDTSIIDQELLLSEFKIKKVPLDTPFPSLGILKNLETGIWKQSTSAELEIRLPNSNTKSPKSGNLSTVDILKVAGENFIQSSSQKVDDLSVVDSSFSISLYGLSEDEKQDVELVQNLLASAEKIGEQKFKSASKTLGKCADVSLKTGSPVERLAYYFSEALQEKINRETGQIGPKSLEKKQLLKDQEAAAVMGMNPVTAALDQQLPYCQICIYTAMQAIIENVAEAKKIHVIDLEIRSGLQYTVLMQALAPRSDRRIEHLKITAVGTKTKEAIDKTGEWLKTYAESMDLPLSFNVVMVKDVLDLKIEHFEVEKDEKIAVYSSFALRAIIGKPDRLESLMRVIRSMNPCLMVLTEVEANHTSPVFVKRFIESLFFFGAYFDCIGECMDSPHRMLVESVYYGPGIKDIVAVEGSERMFRHVKISVWRAFFRRFSMVEERLSSESLYQASLVLKKMSCWGSCSLILDNNKSLIMGWKGTPKISVSAWKFL